MALHHLFPKWAPVALVVGRRGIQNSGTRDSWQAEAERDLHALSFKKILPRVEVHWHSFRRVPNAPLRDNYYKGVNGQNRPHFWTFSRFTTVFEKIKTLVYFTSNLKMPWNATMFHILNLLPGKRVTASNLQCMPRHHVNSQDLC